MCVCICIRAHTGAHTHSYIVWDVDSKGFLDDVFLQALMDNMYRLLHSLNGVKKHPCITFFLTKAFPKIQVSLLCVPVPYLNLLVERVVGIRVGDCTPVWNVHTCIFQMHCLWFYVPHWCLHLFKVSEQHECHNA